MIFKKQRYMQPLIDMLNDFDVIQRSVDSTMKMNMPAVFREQLKKASLDAANLETATQLRMYLNAAQYLTSLRYSLGFTQLKTCAAELKRLYAAPVDKPEASVVIAMLNYYKYQRNDKPSHEMAIYYAGLCTDKRWFDSLPAKSIN